MLIEGELNMDRMPLISVVIPVYKVEKYLRRCIESVQTQTYSNLEIILVDDGSPDMCGVICDEYAVNDGRIHVIHKTNGGLSDARNSGIDFAHGEYLGFVDSDDYIANDMYELLYRRICENNADISICDATIVNDGTEGIFTESNIIDICKGENILLEMIYHNKFTVNAWNKLYRRELFREIRYPQGMLYEDLATTYRIMMLAKCVVYDHSKKYAYIQRNGSIMEQTGFKVAKDKVEIVSEMWNYFASSEVIHKKKIQAGILKYIINDIFRMLVRDNLRRNPRYKEALKEFVNAKWHDIILNPFVSIYHKGILVLYLQCPAILEKMYKIKRRKK